MITNKVTPTNRLDQTQQNDTITERERQLAGLAIHALLALANLKEPDFVTGNKTAGKISKKHITITIQKAKLVKIVLCVAVVVACVSLITVKFFLTCECNTPESNQ